MPKRSILLGLLLVTSFIPSLCFAAAGAWDLSGATYENKSFSIVTQSPASQDIFFKSDGSKMYILEYNSPNIYQYSLSTPWNVSTATYDSVSTTTARQITGPRGLVFKPDGTKAYLTSDNNDAVYQYTLTTPWNISTLLYDNVSTSTASQTTYAVDVEFKTDGTKMYIYDFVDHKVHQYSLSSAWDVSTASYDSKSYLPTAQDGTPEDVSFSSDGTKMYINGVQHSKVYQYTLSTPWDVSTATYDSINVSYITSDSVQGMYFKTDGTQLYLVSITNDYVYQYILIPNTTPPTASVTAPADGASVRGTAVTISATASDDVLVSGVKFYINGTLQGSEDTTSPYSITWNTTATTSGSKIIVAVARDSSNNYGTSTPITVTSDNTAPTISNLATTSLSATGITATWTTNENADSQINYGLTSTYGATTTLDATLGTSHSHAISGLTGSTLYHFRVRSSDAAGNLVVSSDQTFTTASSDSSAPSVTLTLPTSGASISGSAIGMAASASDDVAVVGVKFYVNGVLVGAEDTSSPYTQTWNSIATSSGSRTVFAVARDAAGNQATSSSATVTLNNFPTPTSVTVSTATTTARVTWTTPIAGSSRMFFGMVSATGSSTPETNTSSKVTSHSLDLSSLPACAVYKYVTVSKNDGADVATSSESTLKTGGCAGGASILSNGESAVTAAAGGTLTEGLLSLTIPTSFTATSSTATFQASKLDGSTFFSSVSPPTGLTRAGTTVYHLTATVDETTTLSTFAQPLSVSLTYTDADIVGVDATTLKIHRYDDTTWNELSSCSTNTSTKTVTCTTTAFSDFAIFGGASSSSSSSTGGGGGILGLIGSTTAFKGYKYVEPRPQIVYPDGHIVYLDTASSTESLPGDKTATSSVSGVLKKSSYHFNRTLRARSSGEDVRQLQKFLNENGFVIALRGVGSPGNEGVLFGPLTYNALVKFQEVYVKEILVPVGLTKGTGIFSTATRKFVNELLLQAE